MLLLASGLAAGVARPITGPWPKAFPAKQLCSNCGLCRSAVGVASVTEACAFLGDGMSRAEQLEERVHGRGRRYDVAEPLYQRTDGLGLLPAEVGRRPEARELAHVRLGDPLAPVASQTDVVDAI